MLYHVTLGFFHNFLKITIALASIGAIYAGIVDHNQHGYHIVTKHGHHYGHNGYGGGQEGWGAYGGGYGGGYGGSYGGGYGGGYGGDDHGHHDYYVS